MSAVLENYQLEITTRKEALYQAQLVLERSEVFGKFREEQPYHSTTAQFILAEVMYIIATRYKTINYLFCAISWIRAGQEKVSIAIGVDPTASNMFHFDNSLHLRPAANMLEMALFDVDLEASAHNLALTKLDQLLTYSEFIKKHLTLNNGSVETYDQIVSLAEATHTYKGHNDYPSLMDFSDSVSDLGEPKID